MQQLARWKVFRSRIHPFSFMQLEWPKYYQKRGCVFFFSLTFVSEWKLGGYLHSLSGDFQRSILCIPPETLCCALPHIDWYVFYIHRDACLYRWPVFLQWLPVSWRQTLSFRISASIPRTCRDAACILWSQVGLVPWTRAHVRPLLLALYPPVSGRG